MPETQPNAPASTVVPPPSNPNLKRPIGISLDPATDRVLVAWVDHMGKIREASPFKRKPTRGTVIAEIVQRLLAAGWLPGDRLAVVRARKK